MLGPVRGRNALAAIATLLLLLVTVWEMSGIAFRTSLAEPTPAPADKTPS